MVKMCWLVSTILVALLISSNSVTASPDYEHEDIKTMFSYSNEMEVPEMPLACVISGLSYCFEKGDYYPDKKIHKLLSKYVVENYEPPTSRRPPSEESHDCPSNSTENPIYYIIDENDKLRVVVQTPTFKQIYSVKWCSNEGPIKRASSHLSSTFVDHFKFECVNTKMEFKFLVMSESLDKLETATAKGGIPVCCKCRYDA